MKVQDLKTYKVIGGANTGVPDSKIGIAPKEKTSFGQKILNTATGVNKFFGGEAVADTFGATAAKIGKSQQEKDIISAEQPSVKETIGSGIQLGANLLPGAGKGASLLTKAAIGAGQGLAFDVGSELQQGKKVKPGIGTVFGGVLPIAGAVAKPVTKIVGRLLKGVGSGLSGVSTDSIEKIINNPEHAQKVAEEVAKKGNSGVLEENAKTIINGIGKIKKEARQAYGTGLEQLAKEDISPEIFKEKTQPLLDEFKDIKNLEFSEEKNIIKAKDLMKRLSNPELDGKSLRKLADDIESSKYKTATSDERLSFNAFLKNLSGTVKDAISSSTTKLNDINKAFSNDMQLAEVAEDVFGNVDFKNLPEVVKASQKLEGLFAQKGIVPEVVDQFLERIGVNADDFKTAEAVRQISNKKSGANTKGLSIGELMQQATSAVVTPKMIRDISIKTGMAESALIPFLNQMKPATRAILINALVSDGKPNTKR